MQLKTEKKKRRIYIAGPMRGRPMFNFPAFDAAKEFLEKFGWEVVSPADLDRAEGFDPCKAEGQYTTVDQAFMEKARKRDLDALQTCDAIYMLRGWENSVGATAEHAVAEWMGIEVFDEHDSMVDQIRMEHYDKKYGPFSFGENPPLHTYQTGAKRSPNAGKGHFHGIPPVALRRLAQHFENGGKVHGSHNWMQGIPLSHYMDSLNRHLLAVGEGQTDEDHAAAVIWNAVCMLWTDEAIKSGALPKELDDLPFRRHD